MKMKFPCMKTKILAIFFSGNALDHTDIRAASIQRVDVVCVLDAKTILKGITTACPIADKHTFFVL